MHVKRHLNRIFGSFRAKKERIGRIQEVGQSHWDLVDHNSLKEEKNEPPETFQPSFGDNKPSLLKRTLSRRNKKHKEFENRIEEEFPQDYNVEKAELAAAVQEINATINLLSQFQYNQICFSEEDGNQVADDLNSGNDWATEWEDEQPVEEVPKSKDEDILPHCDESAIAIQQLQNWASIDVTEAKSIYEVPVPYNSGVDSPNKTNVLRRSGRSLYNTIRRKRSRKDRLESENEDNLEVKVVSPSTTASDSWVRRSFRRVLYRNNGKVASNDFQDFNKVSQKGTSGPIRVLKKSLTSFGKNMSYASTIMPMPCDCPSNSDFPSQAYYYDDEDAIYEFRRYCQEHEDRMKNLPSSRH